MPQTVIRSLILSVLVVVTSACSYTSVRQHQDFNEIAKSIDSVVVAPPTVTVELVVFTGENERLKEKEDAVGGTLVNLAAEKLQAQGLKVIDFDFEKAITEDEEFAYALTQCREAYQKAKQDLYNGKSVLEEDKATFKTSLGAVVNTIAEKTGAEALVLMEYYGFEKSGGMIAKDVAASVLIGLLTGSVPIQPTEGSSLQIALIDTAGGDVLWTNVKSGPYLDATLAEHALRELPDTEWESKISIAEAEVTDDPVPATEPALPEATQASSAALSDQP